MVSLREQKWLLLTATVPPTMFVMGVQHPRDEGPVRMDAALVLLRVASAAAFLYHGAAILFGAFGGPGPVRFSTSHGWPVTIGYLVGLAQIFGAISVLSGMFARLGAICLAVVMLGAILLVHLPHGFDVSKGGAEYALTQLLIALSLLLVGPGRYSLRQFLPNALSRL
jgi:putative oxidoreductase